MQVMNWTVRLINLKFKVILLLALLLFSCGEKVNYKEKLKTEEYETLVVTNWLDNAGVMKQLGDLFMEKYPDIRVVYEGIENVRYDKHLKFTLKSGIAADIIYVRSYDGGAAINNTGYLQRLNEMIPELSGFPDIPREAWTAEDGTIYAVPSMGVVHGIFYNKSIFEEYGLLPPETWDDFIEICRLLKTNGEKPISFGTAATWALYEILFSGIGANFYGGEETRQKIMKKEIFLNDPIFVKTFRKLMELQEFFPDNHANFTYDDSRMLFSSGEAAMYIGGSWDIDKLVEFGIDLDNTGFFAPPVEKKGDKLQYCFHVDYGVAMNRSARNKDAAEKYIKWVASEEYAQALMNIGPGFFSYTPGNYTLESSLVRDMQSYIELSEPTIRTLWQKLSAEEPTGNGLLGEAMKGLYNRGATPEESAAFVHKGLAWYYKQ